MKNKAILLGVIAVTLLVTVGTVFAAKPASNLAGAQKVPWHLSAAVMPVPPYGSLDIQGSDTASKLIVNQPNGKVEATITGAMNGLHPDTTYTVYLSNGYTKYTPLDTIDVRGTYKWLVLGTYAHDMVITTQKPDGIFFGTGGYPAGSFPYTAAGQTPENITGKVVGNEITFTTTYSGSYNPGYSATVSGTIAADGIMSGNSPWEWYTTDGHATLASGSTGWPGLFISTVQPFTFTTDDSGSGSWHVNLRANDLGTGTKLLSVWINGAGATVLISGTFQVTA